MSATLCPVFLMSFAAEQRRPRPWILAWLVATLAIGVVSLAGAAEIELQMKDGRVLRGALGRTAGLAEQPQPSGRGALQLILFVDDQLRRTFVPTQRRQEVRYPKHAAPLEPFVFKHRAKHFGKAVASAGRIVSIEPFDQYGRRRVTMQSRHGPVDIVQGITELTPKWAKVEGITHVWETRIPPSSIPGDVLAKLLNRQPDAQSVEHQKRVARFYLQMERYEDAQSVLEALLKRKDVDAAVRRQVQAQFGQIRQLSAQRLLGELKRRRELGQHQLVRQGLKWFPSKDVAGEILVEVRELLKQYQDDQARLQRITGAIKDLTAAVGDAQVEARVAPVAQEIEKELNFSTLGRMAAFRLAMDDEDMTPSERLALAASGWLLGSNAATTNLPRALSAFEVRKLLRAYLNESSHAKRAGLLETLASQEAAVPQTVARLLEHMKPPLASRPVEGKPGYYELEVAGLDKQSPVRHLVQTPPEYDPYRVYPTIVTLHGQRSSPERQIDWWAGASTQEGQRHGQAGRHGYIVVAPQWTEEGQRKYLYSARAHAAVLRCLRDACRRFSIDTDRVYLSGHAMGGDAAWDLGLAHPDLWAGVIPIVANSRRYCFHYWENAKYVPFYFVGGERDGGWLAANARNLDRYFTRGFNTTVVEYLGRGREHYYDEILRIFDWMAHFKRDFYPREFSCNSMRPWDNFFWWVELEGMPEKAMVQPQRWPPPRGTRPVNTKGRLTSTNGVRVQSGASRVTVWLSPKTVDFRRRVSIVVDGKEVNKRSSAVKPDLATMLEDVRTRADRLHPFWAKVEADTGRAHNGR